MTAPTHKTVLIADDDHELVHALALRSRRVGLDVLAAYDAFTALSLVKSTTPDLICLDVEMPGGNGLSVCEMLASDEHCRSIPIIIVTGKRDEETIRRCHNMCAYYVEKGADIWGRVAPLLEELLDVRATEDRETTAGPLAASQRSGMSDANSHDATAPYWQRRF